MSKLLTCSQIADQALREIGAFSVYDQAPDPVEQAVTLTRLDLLIAEIAGTENLWFLRPFEQRVPLAIGDKNKSMAGLLDPQYQFFSTVQLRTVGDAVGQVTELEMIDRRQYEAIPDKDRTGTPDRVYVERKDIPSLALYPVIDRADMELVIWGQRYAVTASGNGGKDPHGFTAAWQRGLILKLAADIGAGPVRTIPMAERDDKDKRGERAMSMLRARNNREQIRRPRKTRPWL